MINQKKNVDIDDAELEVSEDIDFVKKEKMEFAKFNVEPDTKEGATDWIEHNKKYSNIWPNITKKRSEDVPKDQEKWRNVEGKFKYFSEKPGKGD